MEARGALVWFGGRTVWVPDYIGERAKSRQVPGPYNRSARGHGKSTPSRFDVPTRLDIIVNADDDVVMRYPGGKGKCFQQIVNLMPVHETYIESHLGGAAVMRNKRPAVTSIGVDKDARVIERWGEWGLACQLVQDDATAFLARYPFRGDELVYADPPYLRSTRRRRTSLYRHEMDDAGHRVLLALLISLPCRVMVSGYDNPLYRELLETWRCVTFQAKTHVDVRQECVWLNFEPPEHLHDASHLGATFRERQAVKRRHQRWLDRLAKLPTPERHHVLELIDARFRPAGDVK